MTKIELFSGPGGVGKTTLSASRAIYLSKKGQRTLLITIDPARRLRQVMGLSDSDGGVVEELSPTLSALLFNPQVTFSRILKAESNRILKILARPYTGMNELLALVELHHQVSGKHWDTIVVDTPPGGHFLDFLDSCRRIQDFFTSSYRELFEKLGAPLSARSKIPFLGKIVQVGLDAMLKQLEKVTGEGFVSEFIDAIQAIYRCKDDFLSAIQTGEELLHGDTQLFFVSSPEQWRAAESKELQARATELHKAPPHFLINKTQSIIWDGYEPSNDKQQSIKDYFLSREQALKASIEKSGHKWAEFPEVVNEDTSVQLEGLAGKWDQTSL